MNEREQRRRENGQRSIVLVVSSRVYRHFFGSNDRTGGQRINTVLELAVDEQKQGRKR